MGMFKTTLLLAGLTGILMFMGKAVGGNGGMMLMFIISMGMNFFSYWYSDKIVLKMYGAPASDHAGSSWLSSFRVQAGAGGADADAQSIYYQ